MVKDSRESKKLKHMRIRRGHIISFSPCLSVETTAPRLHRMLLDFLQNHFDTPHYLCN